MNRIDRLTAMLIKLQSKRRTSTNELAEHFNISLRTVFRDLRALGEAGVPIGHEPDMGYYIVEGYYLPPVLFTKKEAAAIMVAGKFVEKQGDKSVAQSFNNALLKIKSVLNNSEKDYLESLDQYVEVLKPNLIKTPIDSDFFLTEIKDALAEKKVLSFEYYSNYNDSTTGRCVEPMGLCHYGNHWHLIAYCKLRKAVRDFRTDRIMKLQKTEEFYDMSTHDDYRKHVGMLFTGTDLEAITIRFDKKTARFITDQKYYYGLVSEVSNDESIEMTFMASQYEYFAYWLISFGNGFEVISPVGLKEKLKSVVLELHEKHVM